MLLVTKNQPLVIDQSLIRSYDHWRGFDVNFVVVLFAARYLGS